MAPEPDYVEAQTMFRHGLRSADGAMGDRMTIDGAEVPPERLESMLAAAREVTECRRVLAKTGDTMISEVLRGNSPFSEWRHFPPGDVYDAEYHAQYYYHAHAEREQPAGEHGHFHTFLRPGGMPAGIRPAPLPDLANGRGDDDELSHLVAIAVDHAGEPVRLFCTNRWVTGETWYAAADVVRMLDGFRIDVARPSWPLNRWLTALLVLFRPQIEALLAERDAAVAAWQAAHPDVFVYEDRTLEVAAERAVDVGRQIRAVERARHQLRREGRSSGNAS